MNRCGSNISVSSELLTWSKATIYPGSKFIFSNLGDSKNKEKPHSIFQKQNAAVSLADKTAFKIWK